MDEPPRPRSREERLAAKLRENLRRRKAQARGLEQVAGTAPDQPPEQPGNGALPKGGTSR